MTEIPRDRIVFELNADITAKIDVLIDEDLYQSRDEFLERAISEQLRIHNATFEKYEKDKATVVGFLHYSAKSYNDP